PKERSTIRATLAAPGWRATASPRRQDTTAGEAAILSSIARRSVSASEHSEYASAQNGHRDNPSPTRNDESESGARQLFDLHFLVALLAEKLGDMRRGHLVRRLD